MSNIKNTESYSRLVDICSGYGGKYNPGHQTLQLKAMRALLKEAQSSLQDVSLKQDAYHRTLNERGSAFDGLSVLANRVIGIMETLQMPAATIEDARYFSRLVAGMRAKARPPIPSEVSDEETQKGKETQKDKEALKTPGFGQLSYVAKANNFFKLAQMVQSLPAYTSNEPELQVPALLKKAATLQPLNDEVHKAKLALSVARLQRNRILYRNKTGIVDTAKAVKRYLRVVFGTRSGEAAQLKDVRFTKQKVK